MRRSILIIATAVFSFTQVNAANGNKTPNTSIEVSTLTKDQLVIVYEWSVKTNKGHYAGISPNLADAKEMIALSSSGEIIREKKVESYYRLASDVETLAKRTYFWEVTSTKSHAKGYTSTKADAERVMRLVASGDIISSKIIFSKARK